MWGTMQVVLAWFDIGLRDLKLNSAANKTSGTHTQGASNNTSNKHPSARIQSHLFTVHSLKILKPGKHLEGPSEIIEIQFISEKSAIVLRIELQSAAAVTKTVKPGKICP